MKQKDLAIKKKYGHTVIVGQAISLINTNHLRHDLSAEKKICDMIHQIFKNRHRIGVEFALKRFPVLKTALLIIKNEK